MKIRDLRSHTRVSVKDQVLETVMFQLSEAWLVFVHDSAAPAGCPSGKSLTFGIDLTRHTPGISHHLHTHQSVLGTPRTTWEH